MNAKRALLAATLACVTPLAMATSAHAVDIEYEYGRLTATEGCFDYGVQGNDLLNSGMGCFERYGDIFRVWARNMVDGSPRLHWINEQKDSNGVWVKKREGVVYGEWFRNSWVYLNKNFYENSTYPNDAGGQGSRIKFQYYDSAGWTSYHTVLNDA
ncbi:hypothetical protein ACI2L1_40170 [Streptomyces sp. NPDC019531]|uniref:hypothetical protein n=1 Tax=Streptomyces sp. NPDC019531 TaxID=3365062 RepID=UPI00384A4E8B